MAESPDDELGQLRSRIDQLDAQIVRLLSERAGLVTEIGRLKQRENVPIYAPDREKEVLERIRRLNPGPLPDHTLAAIWREMMSGSFALERPLKIGFLGPAASFSHGAARARFGSSVEYIDLADISGVFDEVARRRVDYGVVPVENSIHGSVIDTLDAFQQHPVRICAEIRMSIHHHVLSAGPWEQVRTVCSKPEVFSQCRGFISHSLEERTTLPVASTSKAAEMAASDPTLAAIASAVAAEKYGLNTLFNNIEDDPDNMTRFFVIGTEPARRSGDDMTAIMFRTANTPGALVDVLSSFKSNGINLTDIEKRPAGKAMREYCFFIDAQGHPDDPAMQSALADAQAHCLQLKVLGSYPRSTQVL
jgi:chorismate mutase/prephenate dehydratase